MPIKATRHYKIVRPGDIHPTAFNVGDDVPDWAEGKMLADGAAADSDGAVASVEPVVDPAGVDSGTEPTERGPVDRRIVAKTTQKVEIEVDGKPTKFGKGVTVYDEIARRLVEMGVANPVIEAPADKSLPGAPSTK